MSEYGEPHIVEQKIYDMSNLYTAFLTPALYFDLKLGNFTPEERAEFERKDKIRKKWCAQREMFADDRELRIKEAIIATVGKRHWEWYESTLHEDCGDW